MILLDSSALVAGFLGEPAAPEVGSLLRRDDVGITAPNLTEVIDVLVRVFGNDLVERWCDALWDCAGLSAVLYATVAIWAGILGLLMMPGDRWSGRQILGALAGIAGLAVIFSEHLHISTASILPIMAVILGAVCTALGMVVVRRWGPDLPLLPLNGLSMLVAGCFLYVISLLSGEVRTFPTSTVALTSVLFLGVFVSGISYILYFWLLRKWSTHRVGMAAVVNPAIAVALGIIVLTEPLSWLQGAGTVLVFAGVAIGILAPRDPEGSPTHQESSPA